MIEKSTVGTRLCPYCANSIDEDATNCRYCKKDFSPESTPQWLHRNESSSEPRVGPGNQRRYSIPTKFIWPAALLLATLIAFFAGRYLQRHETFLVSQASQKNIQAKDQIIQSQEAQLAETRQQLNENSKQLTEIKTKLDESEKKVSLAQQRLSATSREVDRLNTNRPPVVRRTSARGPDTTAPLPQPVSARRTAEAGVYETTRATSVYEGPSATSRVISQIGGGTRLNVVSSAGDWLEVRSKHGNPPGYVRSDDARMVARAN